MTIANTILQQLGGRRFIIMTGAKNFIAMDGGALSFQLPKAKDGINRFKVTLTAMDDYRLEAFRVTRSSFTAKGEMDGIYADQLRGAFEKMTGLATSL